MGTEEGSGAFCGITSYYKREISHELSELELSMSAKQTRGGFEIFLNLLVGNSLNRKIGQTLSFFLFFFHSK